MIISTILHTYIAYLLCTVIYMPHFDLQIYDTGVFIVLRHCAVHLVQVDKSEADPTGGQLRLLLTDGTHSNICK